MAETKNRYANWDTSEDGTYRAVGTTTMVLPAACYNVRKPYSQPWYLQPTAFHADTVLQLPGMPTAFLTEQLTLFWSRATRFKSCGLLHKRGMLMYGTPGCGKTSIIKAVAEAQVARGGLVFIVEDVQTVTEMLTTLREIEPERPVMTIFEDIEKFAKEPSWRPHLLSLLDGESQIEHVAHLATTNIPDSLDDTLVKRPGRFDMVVELRPPVRAAREQYLRHLLNGGISEAVLQDLVDKSAGLSLAHLRELVVATYCLDADQQETLTRLLGNTNRKHFERGCEERLGFSVRFHEKAND